MFEKIKNQLLRPSDAQLIDEAVEKYGGTLKGCTGIISIETCEWIATFVAEKRVVLKVGVRPPNGGVA